MMIMECVFNKPHLCYQLIYTALNNMFVGLSEGSESVEMPEFIYGTDEYDKSCVHSCVNFSTVGVVKSALCLPNKDYLTAFAEGNKLKLVNTIDGTVRIFEGHREDIIHIHSQSADEIITMSKDGGIHIWQAVENSDSEYNWINYLRDSRNNLTSLAVSGLSLGKIVATTRDGYICVWSRNTCLHSHSTLIDSKGLYSVDICDDQGITAIGGYGRVFLHDSCTDELSHITTLGGHNGPVFAVVARTILGVGYVASGGEDKMVAVHRMDTFTQCAYKKDAHTSAVTSMALAARPDSHLLVTGSRDSSIHIWTFPTLEIRHKIKSHDGVVLSVSVASTFHRFGHRQALISTGLDKTVKVWKLYAMLNWERRKNFMMFLVNSGFIECCNYGSRLLFGPSKSTPQENSSENSNHDILRVVFMNKSLCREVSSYL